MSRLLGWKCFYLSHSNVEGVLGKLVSVLDCFGRMNTSRGGGGAVLPTKPFGEYHVKPDNADHLGYELSVICGKLRIPYSVEDPTLSSIASGSPHPTTPSLDSAPQYNVPSH